MTQLLSLDTKVYVLTYDGMPKSAYSTKEKCNQAIYENEEEHWNLLDWECMTFREWQNVHSKNGLLGRADIDC
ncbi:hypothetical protein [Acinetobacter baumannii]|uniref:hypothetical protein n=1 Tax=Acinetobacter baumannii TaxID=470 RepID=UPI0008DE29BD|nr:hypothetical protein [Acinetobacter baumannii]MCE6930384.1 hypothetical protein [Acinetobacter baumannii]MCZ0638436.1 hypothetical protein [Acinetobacter baumannii]MCZ0638473.1 hypothetical protein [Acinetobacter baumannii]MVO43825.1 hypothetical protein [Acinetobacter baumannii]OIB66669.1 hypothetical protein A7L34_12545 [Acinetobacter baumannii]